MANLVTAHSLALAKDVAMGPMCSAFPAFENFGLQSNVLWLRKSGGGIGSVNYSANGLALRQGGVMDCARIPDNNITRLGIDLDQLAAVALKPLDILKSETVPVELARSVLGLGLGWVLLEEQLEELGRTLEKLETTIKRPSLRKVDNTLSTGETLASRGLINVRPGSPFDIGSTGKRDVESIERDKEFIGSPQFGKRLDNTGLTVNKMYFD